MLTWLIIATLLCLGGCAQPYYREPQRQSLHVLKTVKSPEYERPRESKAISQALLEAQETSSWLESMPAVSPCASDRLKFCKDVKGPTEDIRACLTQHKGGLSEACSTQLSKSVESRAASGGKVDVDQPLLADLDLCVHATKSPALAGLSLSRGPSPGPSLFIGSGPEPSQA
jgi:hypothetical protein